MKRKIYTVIVFLMLGISALLLVNGSGILGKPLARGSGFPLGTIITWIGLIALPSSVYFGIDKSGLYNSSFRNFLVKVNIAIIFMAFLWGPISYFLAGNWAYVFSPGNGFRGSSEASQYFWAYTTIIVFVSLLLFIAHMVSIIISRFRRSK